MHGIARGMWSGGMNWECELASTGSVAYSCMGECGIELHGSVGWNWECGIRTAWGIG